MSTDPRTTYGAALRGDIESAVRARDSLASDRELDRAWRATLDALIAFATSTGVEAALGDGALARLELRDADARGIGAMACAHIARARALAFDAHGLERARTRIEHLTEGLDEPEALGHRDVVRAWADVFAGRRIGVDLEAVVRSATRDGRSELALEAMALRALDALEASDLDGALALARRASRMGRTESIPLFEHLVNLILARVRRKSGHPHLATRILNALLAVSSAPLRPCLVFELALARGKGASLDPSLPGSRAPIALDLALDAAWGGDPTAFDAASTELADAVGDCVPYARDVAAMRAVVDPRTPVPEWLVPFARGETHTPPCGSGGLADPVVARSGHLAWVVAHDGSEPRRILATGVALTRALSRARVLDEASGSLRTDSAIATLLLAGTDGIDEDTFFRKLYGFDYEPERHQSVRGVLYGRVRKRLEPAELAREGGRARIVFSGSLLAPDPRCTPPPELGILRVLAERKRAAPKDVAAALGIPLRTAQDFLRRLTEDGAVRAERAARGLHYVLEDTTFSEPTRTLQSGGA